MLQIQNVRKEYRTGSLVQKALDDVSLNLRDNEFVAILGPSGSGKSTLLNIIGGLDRYDSGDLIIDGVSTKRYKDRDWDAYRNHTIGFVFQSYNLIAHQTILANVELALTIGGISKKERRKRAIEALQKVGLGNQIHKKPNQMSGGQMQRVAIARALVGNPRILLADEPTGALDSETSVQIMDLLREVAKDRLVVMVTHNPELAEQYATRIVSLKDGVILSDTDPFTVENSGEVPVHKRLGKASMSTLTALSLSFNNLKTKLARTVLVAFAGSIGIIGIALILSLSTGADTYIHNVQEEALSEYPLQLYKNTVATSTLDTFMGTSATDGEEDAEVTEISTVTSLFSNMTANDLASFKEFIESGESGLEDYTRSIEYVYSVTPLIYRETDSGIRQVNPDTLMAKMGYGGSGYTSAFSSMMTMDPFSALPRDEALYKDQYDLMAGHWPENENECIVVLMRTGGISDIVLYATGLKDPAELDQMMEDYRAMSTGSSLSGSSDVSDTDFSASAEKEGNTSNTNSRSTFNYEDFLGITFSRINAAELYTYDETYNVWKDKSEDADYIAELVENGQKLTIVGVAKVPDGQSVSMLTSGIYYMADLSDTMITEAGDAEIVKRQLADPDTNVITGRAFADEAVNQEIDLTAMFTINEDAMQNIFSFDTSAFSFDASAFNLNLSGLDVGSMIDVNALMSAMPSLTTEDILSLLNGVNIEVNEEELSNLASQLTNGYSTYISGQPALDYTQLGEAVLTYISQPEVSAQLSASLQSLLTNSNIASIDLQPLTDAAYGVASGFPAWLISTGLQDLSDLTQMQGLMEQYLQTPEVQAQVQTGIAALQASLSSVTVPTDQINQVIADTMNGYTAYAKEHNLPDPERIRSSFGEYFATEEAQGILSAGIPRAFNTDAIAATVSANAQGLVSSKFGSVQGTVNAMIANMSGQFSSAIGSAIQNSMGGMMSQIQNQLQSALQLNTDSFADLIQMNMDEAELQELMRSLLTTQTTSYSENLETFGYARLDDPNEIVIYPLDFESKNEVVNILKQYNKDRTEKGEDSKVITFTDTVATLMSSVTDIVNAISYVLIAFVAISLVVSSIMIGVITYISVLERRKEIGILRAIGASKRNISMVFNAETFIIGLLAGAMGIGIAYLLIFPINYVIHKYSGMNDINAILPAGSSAVLIALSIVLTLIGGLIPSKKAARQDPVTALRTD